MPRHQVSPVPLQPLDPCHLHRVAVVSRPGTDNSGDNPLLNKVLEAAVRILEIDGVDPGERSVQVRSPAFILPHLLKCILVGVRPAHNLNHGETLGRAVGRQFAETVPRQPFGKTFPPGIPEPEKGRAVGMGKMPVVRGHLNRTWRYNGLSPV